MNILTLTILQIHEDRIFFHSYVLSSISFTSVLQLSVYKVFISVKFILSFSSVQFSCSVMSNSLWTHGLQHIRSPCPSPTLRVYPSSCPLSWLCHPTISSSGVPCFSCLQSFPAVGSFQKSQLFTSGGQSIGVSASTSVLLMNTQDWWTLG